MYAISGLSGEPVIPLLCDMQHARHDLTGAVCLRESRQRRRMKFRKTPFPVDTVPPAYEGPERRRRPQASAGRLGRRVKDDPFAAQTLVERVGRSGGPEGDRPSMDEDNAA
jgi:hypothetical protein